MAWSDQSPFELFHHLNSQNNWVWAFSSSDVPIVPVINIQPRAMSGACLATTLCPSHMLFPRRQPSMVSTTWTTSWPVNTCRHSTRQHRGEEGSVCKHTLMLDPSQALFMHYSALPHTWRQGSRQHGGASNPVC